MTELTARLALFTALPILLGAALVALDRSAAGPVRRLEAFLVPLFLIGIGGGGVSSFIANAFISDRAAAGLGWEPGSPFQLIAAAASLAVGILGAAAAERRDGFRDATVLAALVLGLGTAAAHTMSIIGGSTALAHALHAINSLIVPVLLLWCIAAVRRAEQEEPQTIVLRSWMVPLRRGAVVAAGIGATAFPLGYSTGQMVLLALGATVVAAAAFWLVVSRSASHRVQPPA